MLKGLSKYLIEDSEKKALIDDLLVPKYMLASPEYSHRMNRSVFKEDQLESDYCAEYAIELTKYCPKCKRQFSEDANFCYDCLCALKYIDGRVSVHDIKTKPAFTFKGHNDYSSFDEIFTDSNMDRINDFKFSTIDFLDIIKNIKRTALKNMDDLIKANKLNLSELTTDEKILLFAKSFADVEFKSYGRELGHFEFNKITVDERLLSSLYSTTLIHELSHFLLKEIIAEILSKLLDANKNSYIDAIAVYILSYEPFTQLIDEYAAHSVEGRFTIYGYQDYSSFLDILDSLDGEMPSDEVEITKSIANTFASYIKDILETFIDRSLRRDIKNEFRLDHLERPNYEMLRLENCNNLTEEGFLKAIWLVVSEGFHAASLNIAKLESYEKSF